jgi:hypothetical protein
METDFSSNAYDSTLMSVAGVAHHDGKLLLVIALGSDGTIPMSPAYDESSGVNTWMTKLNSHIYYGTYDAAGRQVRNASTSSMYPTSYLIANANLSDPCSLALQRAYNTQHVSLARHRFWTRTDQLIIGNLKINDYDIVPAALGTTELMTSEYVDYQVNTTAGNTTIHRILGRGIVDGYGTTPLPTLVGSWSINATAWVGINHSTESSPTLATPTIVGTPTTAERTSGSGSVTITKPTGATAGEILLMIEHLQSGAEFTSGNVPAGFEPISHGFNGGDGAGNIQLWMKVVDGTEPSSWTVNVSGAGIITMQRMTGILPWSGKHYGSDTSTLANPQPHTTPTILNPGVILRVSAYQDGTARVIATSIGTAIQPDYDSPPLSTSTTHIEITGEIVGTATVGAADYTTTPFPGAPVAARAYLYHLDAAPA